MLSDESHHLCNIYLTSLLITRIQLSCPHSDVCNCQPYCDLRLFLDKHRVSPSGSASSLGEAKCTSDDSCRDTAESVILGTSPVHAVSSFSYNRPVKLKHTYNYVLTRVLIQVTIINSLPERDCRLSGTSSLASSFPSNLSSSWEVVLRFVQ
ncbi:unnamed protein product [Hymenolepis diminuta]|uniref:Uncharacterized protein n=1 Tax=Hymenolepis diminuta TaxID=6216 RepID=A0A564YZ83_HYMDI|nr:unnamed protein product [Hymenolepis diminuta]